MFNTKYPIVAVGMNKVSDISLALAVANAGGVATVSGFNYLVPVNTLDLESLTADFELYKADRSTCDFIFSVEDRMLINYPELLEIFDRYEIKYLELITSPEFVKDNHARFDDVIKKIKKRNIKLLVKMITIPVSDTSEWKKYINDTFDGIIIKGPNGAGRVLSMSSKSLLELTEICLKNFPGKIIIPSGGVGTSTDVLDLLCVGAHAVGIGTLFAASVESSLSEQAKEKLVMSDYSEVTQLNTTDLKQNALVFTDVEQDRENNTRGLLLGIQTGSSGHIFAGRGINNVNKIKSVKEIITNLCSLL
jgi:NAD(P)H-dependent flavin oxidoreductase YrpB (nitropropane dioxygenase family)